MLSFLLLELAIRRKALYCAGAMGKFDSRASVKMTRRRRQAKKKARLGRKAETARATRKTTAKPTRKKAATAAAAS